MMHTGTVKFTKPELKSIALALAQAEDTSQDDYVWSDEQKALFRSVARKVAALLDGKSR